MPLRLFIALALATFAVLPAQAQTQATVTTTAAAPATVSEEAVVGTVMEAEGAVNLIVPNAPPRTLKVNDVVHMNDVIETGLSARAFILLIDDTELTLGENAQLTIDEYVFDEEDTAANKGRYSILRGAFLYTSGLVAKKENPDVEINTPYGAIGIRGTSFWGGDIDGEYGVLVTEGRVSVQTERGRIYVDKGQGTSLRAKTSIPARAAVWSEEKVGRAVKTIALQDANGVRQRVEKHADKQKAARVNFKENLRKRQNMQQPGTAPHAPVKRIDNRPHLDGQKEGAVKQLIEKPATNKVAAPAPAVVRGLEDTPPPAITDDLNKPIQSAPLKMPAENVSPLLKTAPTNAAPKTIPQLDRQLKELNKEVKEKGASAAPAVDLPSMGNNEAHSKELQERQHLQRRQPVMQRPAAPRSKAAGAL